MHPFITKIYSKTWTIWQFHHHMNINHSVWLYQTKRSTTSLHNIILEEHHYTHSLLLNKISCGILLTKILFSSVHENDWTVHLLNTHIILLNSIIPNQCMIHKEQTYEWRVYSSYSRIVIIFKLISLICHIKKNKEEPFMDISMQWVQRTQLMKVNMHLCF